MSRIVVFGSINIDESTHVDHIPVTGETVVALSEPRRSLGGKGANQAIAARVLESEVILVGALGSDEAGDWASAQLGSYRVELDQVQVVGAPSGRATILIMATGDNAIVVASGANAQVINAAPMVDAWTVELAETLRHSRILIVNEIEATQLAALAGLPADEIQAIGRLLRGLGPETVIITRGGDGMLASSPQGELAVSAFGVDVVDTTGAGDACCAAIAVALLRGADLAAAVAAGNAAGAHSVERPGTAESFGRMEELEGRMQHAGAPR